MNADDSRRGRAASAIITVGIVIVIIGLFIAVAQTYNIGTEVTFGEQADLLGKLCWILAGMAIELFGVGIIFTGSKKW